MTRAPGGFAGMANIVRFNLRFYLGSAAGIVVAAVAIVLVRLPAVVHLAAIAGVALALWWTLSSLAVSWYVYDHAAVQQWDLLPPLLGRAPQRWVNIHAGLDESTARLRQLLPGSDGVVVDIYDPRTMTEPSIARARALCPATEPFLPGRADALPLPDGGRDVVFLLFAAHEVRSSTGRTALLREARRVLAPGGCVLLVEHVRDAANLAAFGPGFFHFHPVAAWLREAERAGLRVAAHGRRTPFVRYFVLREAPQ